MPKGLKRIPISIPFLAGPDLNPVSRNRYSTDSAFVKAFVDSYDMSS